MSKDIIKSKDITPGQWIETSENIRVYVLSCRPINKYHYRLSGHEYKTANGRAVMSKINISILADREFSLLC